MDFTFTEEPETESWAAEAGARVAATARHVHGGIGATYSEGLS